jgi:cation/acetate symporter
MKCARFLRRGAGFAAALTVLLSAARTHAAEVVPGAHRPYAFGSFAAVILLTLTITWWAARKGNTASDFYTAGGGISGAKNGLAIAGDYLSAAAFLGVSGLIALYGYDGILYLVGFFVAFVPVLLLVAEPCRNLGRYTFGDVLAYRHDFRTSKLLAAVSSVIVAIFYMIPQIVGGAVLLYALLGVPYEVSIIVVGTLMLIYVTFGGMRATTWVQIVKAALLLTACTGLVVLALIPIHFNMVSFFTALSHQTALSDYLTRDHATVDSGDVRLVTKTFFEPGLYLKNPVELLSLGLALTLGTAAMPHIMMRFFSVRDAQTARKSVLWGMLWIGGCHLMIIFLGFAAAYYVGGFRIAAIDKGGNLAAPLLAQYLGGGADSPPGNLLLGLVAAVAFATIVAVVAGLTLAAASALAHDVYVGALKGGNVSDREQVVAGKVAALLVGLVAIGASLLAKGQNVAHLVGLAFAVAASANLPALLGTLYWKRCNTFGVTCSVVGGTVTAIVLVLVSPNMQYPQAVRAEESRTLAMEDMEIQTLQRRLVDPASTSSVRDASTAALTNARRLRAAAQASLDGLGQTTTSIVGLQRPLINLRNPGIVSIPLGVIFLIFGSLIYSRGPTADDKWRELVFRRDSGVGIDKAVGH